MPIDVGTYGIRKDPLKDPHLFFRNENIPQRGTAATRLRVPDTSLQIPEVLRIWNPESVMWDLRYAIHKDERRTAR
jgi:hypothetical protein